MSRIRSSVTIKPQHQQPVGTAAGRNGTGPTFLDRGAQMRVLFTTAPMHGHLFPLVPLAWACRAAGHEVLVATTEHFVPSVVQAGLPAAPVGPGMALSELAAPAAAHGIDDAPYAHGEVFGAMASRNLADTRALVETWRPDLVVNERSELAGPVAAAAAGTPHAELRWGVAELTEYRAAGEDVLRDQLRALGLPGLPTPGLRLSPWPPSLRLPHARADLSLRHVSYNGAAVVPAWASAPGTRPRICLTLGTVIPQLSSDGAAGFLRRLVDSLGRLGCELVIAVDDAVAEELGTLPETVLHAGRVPLAEVLPGCRLLIHHGGQGSALTGLAAGCPQVVLPRFDDALENAQAVVDAGVGLSLRLEQATPQGVADHAGRVLADPRFRAAAATVAREIAAQPAPAEVVGVLERLVAGGAAAGPGRSTEPATFTGRR